MSKSSEPKYTTSTYFVVNSLTNSTVSATDSQRLASTYAALLPRDQTISRVIAPALQTDPAAALDQIAVVLQPDSAVLRVDISADSEGQAIAATTAFTECRIRQETRD